MIIVRSPLRVSFFGGGTDYEKWFSKNKGAFLSMAIDKYCFSVIKYTIHLSNFNFRVSWKQVEEVNQIEEIRQPIVREVLKYFDYKKSAEYFYMADVPAQSGLGSSASYTVAMIKAISSIKKISLTKTEIANIAYIIEKEKLQENTGIQDSIASAFGGFNFVEIEKDKSFKVTNCNLNKEFREKFLERVLIVFTGIQRSSSKQAGKTLSTMERNNEKFREIYDITYEGFKILKSLDLDSFGRLIDETWKIKSSLNKSMSNLKIDELYHFSKKEGALGMKLLGAGGGGFAVIFFKEGKKEPFKKKIKKYKFIEVSIDEEGTKIIE